MVGFTVSYMHMQVGFSQSSAIFEVLQKREETVSSEFFWRETTAIISGVFIAVLFIVQRFRFDSEPFLFYNIFNNLSYSPDGVSHHSGTRAHEQYPASIFSAITSSRMISKYILRQRLVWSRVFTSLNVLLKSQLLHLFFFTTA